MRPAVRVVVVLLAVVLAQAPGRGLSQTAAQQAPRPVAQPLAVSVRVDATRVAQIISNLLNNAARYTPSSGKIELVAETLDQELVIRVIDTGLRGGRENAAFSRALRLPLSRLRSARALASPIACSPKVAMRDVASAAAARSGRWTYCKIFPALFSLRAPLAPRRLPKRRGAW